MTHVVGHELMSGHELTSLVILHLGVGTCVDLAETLQPFIFSKSLVVAERGYNWVLIQLHMSVLKHYPSVQNHLLTISLQSPPELQNLSLKNIQVQHFLDTQ